MINTVEQSALMRDGKTTVSVGDIVQIEMRNTYWQVVAISGLYNYDNDKDGNIVKVEPYRRYMVRKLFSAKLVFKPDIVAECVHQGWICNPSKRKSEEIEKYFLTHPQDKAKADDLSEVRPAVGISVPALIDVLDGDIQSNEELLRERVGYPVYETEIVRVLKELSEEGKIKIGCAYNVEHLHTFTYRVFVRGYEGCAEKDGTFKFETWGLEKINDWTNSQKAGDILKKKLQNHNGVFNVF